MVKWFCNVCNVEVDKSEKARHIKTIKHQNNCQRDSLGAVIKRDIIKSDLSLGDLEGPGTGLVLNLEADQENTSTELIGIQATVKHCSE